MNDIEQVEHVVQWIRDRIVLPRAQVSKWTSSDAATTKEFIETEAMPALFVSIQNDLLIVSTVAPRVLLSPIMYFVKIGTTSITPANVNQALQYGSISTDCILSLLRLMDGYYLQRIQHNKSWPEGIRKEFNAQFFRLMSSLTETVSRSCGKTVLYLPPWDFSKMTCGDKEAIQQLEITVIHWTRQIKELVNNQDNAQSAEEAGPLEEIRFWELRTQDLSGITEQLGRQNIRDIMDLLRAAKSSYLDPFETLSQIIKQGSLEANDNLKFLKKLSPICEELSHAQPQEITPLLPKVLILIRLIWMYSNYYRTDERISSLLRKVSNEIIIVCSRKISLIDIFDGNVRESIIYLEQSIHCGTRWKQYFHATTAAVNRDSERTHRTWQFDETEIFAQMDAFVQRCRELLQICEGQVQFSLQNRRDGSDVLPMFGGLRGPEICKSLHGISSQFANDINRLKNLDYDILDVKITSWHSDFNVFKSSMKDLEAMTQNIINGAFDNISTVGAGVDLILAFQIIAKRESIKRCVEKRTIDIFFMYKTFLTTIRNMFEKNKQEPPLAFNEPHFAGSALWARSLLLHASYDLLRLQEIVNFVNVAEKEEAHSNHEQFRLVITDYIIRKHHDWVEEMNEMSAITFISRLDVPLMIRAASSTEALMSFDATSAIALSKPADASSALIPKEQSVKQSAEVSTNRKGFLYCNFDRYLLVLFTEVHYWQFFNGEVQIPYQAHEICAQRETLRVLREYVMLLVNDYNQILLDLSPRERRLFESIIRRLDRRVQPGLQKLTWNSKGVVDTYISDCRNHCELVYKMVQDFQESKNVVSRQCKAIASLLHICIERNTIHEDGVFESKQVAYRKEIGLKLKQAHADIVSTLMITYKHFESGPHDVQREWNRFIERCDRMLEDALRQSVKKSLHELSKAINGDAKTDPRSLFRLHVVLEDTKVDFKPRMIDLMQMVNDVAKEVFNVIAVVSRLSSSVHSLDRTHGTNVEGDGAIPSASVGLDNLESSLLKPSLQDNDKPVQLDINSYIVSSPSSTNSVNFFESVCNDEEILKIVAQVMNGMSSSATELQKYLAYWDKYKLLWNQDKQAFIRRYAKANRPLQQFRADIERYRDQQQNIQNEDPTNTINFIQIDTNILKASLVDHTVQWIGKLTGLLNQNAQDELHELIKTLKETTNKLRVKPATLDHLGESIRLLQDVKDGSATLHSRFEPLQLKYDLLSEFDVPVTDEELRELHNVKSQWEAYEVVLVESNTMLQKCKILMKQQLQDSLFDLNALMTDLRNEAESSLPFSSDIAYSTARKVLSEFEKKVENIKNRQKSLAKGLEIFGIEEMKHEGFKQVEREISSLQQIWILSDEWDTVWSKWKTQKFNEIEIESVESAAVHFDKKIQRLGKEMNRWPIWESLKNKVEQFRQTLPLIQDLKSPALRPRHWMQLKDEMGMTFDSDSQDFTLDTVFALGFHLNSDFIQTLTANAAKELSIEQALDGIEKRWNGIEIIVVEYKGVYYKVYSASEIFVPLEDDQVQLSTMKASPYFSSFSTRILHWEKSLARVSEVMEHLLSVQRSWIYLEAIFMISEDIRKQLPFESKMFDEVNATYKKVIEGIKKKKNALQATMEPKILQVMQELQVKLDQIQKCLDQYLETKRMIFPRFYFLSNDDLLEILGHQKDPEQIQKHIKKCFEAIKTLTLIPPGSARGNIQFEALGMNSPCGEQVAFTSSVVVSGAVEGWLIRVEEAMICTLEKQFGQCIAGYKNKKEKWIRDSPGQLLINCGQTVWTSECTKALNEVFKGDKKALKALKRKWVSYLNKLADIGRSPLSSVERKKVVALITVEIHSRDVIDRLLKQSCKSVGDFEWLMQLRYYFNKDVGEFGTCEVRQTVSQLQYSYEYQGNNGRLVVTPLTDRCILTMTTALNLNRGGNPLGPAGTGKTETVKDLGKNLAKYVIVFNCSDGLDYKSVGRMFSGLVQSGSWGCFDEFNRIEIEVLSVVAQQVLTIMQALSMKQAQVNFLGSMIRCNHNMGIFITMNPGYAGRTELPDNLKALMRPCAMMIPDLALISEVMLQAEGFIEAKSLAKKITTLYGLMMQQLSKQDHYDFGLRSLKSVLSVAGSFKREDATSPEEIILLRALHDMNMPKFVNEDVALFTLLLGDLFPGVDVPKTDYGNLQKTIEEKLTEKKLQLNSSIVHKTIQLYESQLTRHCNMLVGQTLSGKSTVWKTLQAAKTHLAKDKVPKFLPVRTQVLNPKSISLNEIYGVYDLTTFEWIDGVLSSIFRALAADEQAEEKWIVLDGPVDTMWIESMNSVMDDNKVLTLINGERIIMSNTMSILFEVQDLAVASPATVSRAGMIYVDVEDLGWQPYVRTWLDVSLEDPNEVTLLHQLFAKYMERILKCKDSDVRELVSTTAFGSVISFCNLYVALPAQEAEKNVTFSMEKFAQFIEKKFLFCLTWSVMAAANEDGRKVFDSCLRDLDTIYPPMKTAYDFYIDAQTQEFRLWDEKLPQNFRIASDTPLHKVIVPTVDTLRYGYLLQTFLNAGIHSLIVGETGVGKTATIEQELNNLDESCFQSLVLYFSSATTSAGTQELIEAATEKRTMNRYGAASGKKLAIYIDDLNMPAKDLFGSQAPLELLRQWMDYGCWYDLKKRTLKHFVDMQIVAAMGPPGGGRSVVSSRLQSRFHLINMTFPEQSQLKRIFETMLQYKLAEFDDEIKPLCMPLVSATIALYQSVLETFLPTPINCHYLFNLRDMSKVIQGLVHFNKRSNASRDNMLRLWIHESLRVFSDRLTGIHDRQVFKRKLDECLSVHFQTDWNRLFQSASERTKDSGPLFCFFMPPAVVTSVSLDVEKTSESMSYTEVLDMKQLKSIVETQLEDHNAEHGVIPMNLVMFGDALMHILRIHRVLVSAQGNLLLVGVGGSGRQSLTKLAAYIAGQKIHQVEVTKTYRQIDFREDIKKLNAIAAIQQSKVVFLFNDTQIKHEIFLADLNNMLSNGEIPGLYERDEQASIIESIRARARAAGSRDTKESLWKFFIAEVRRNLHIVLALSPIGKAFRERCRQFPSIVNNTTINWFDEWPLDALQEVGMKYLEERNVGTEQQRSKIASIFAVVHSSVALASEQLLLRMKRHNYVTPTNFLSLVTGYVDLLREKHDAILHSRDTLKAGFSKLEESRIQVEEMSKQLEQRKVIVAQKNKDCSDLLVVIVSERRVADEQRKQVETDSDRIGREKVETMDIADEAQKDVDEALPALQKAMQEVENLDKKAIAEVKVYSQPPELVSMVMCAVMILFGLQPTWAQAKTKMNDVNFLQQIKTFDKDGIKDKTVAALKKYTSKPSFQPDTVRKVSAAAGALCSWVLAMESYASVYRIVAPKKEALKKSQDALAIKQGDLAIAKEKLQIVIEKVENLKKQYDASVFEKNSLREEADLLEVKLSRAEQLVKGLAGERERWQRSICDKNESLGNVVGDALVAAAFVSYAGPFDSYYRSSLVDTWMNRLTQQEIPISQKFTFIDFLADPVEVRAWNVHGLPRDPLSTENGVLVLRGKRWPLMIDPQGQANKWIKSMERSSLKVVDPMMKDLMRNLENGIRFGYPVLLQDIMEDLDPSLEPVLSKSIIRMGKREIIRLGDKELDYNRDFRFYMTTKLQNPHYKPEISTKASIVNFVVKEQGLEGQLLGITVQLEEPALEEQKSDLVLRVASGKKKLVDLENEILRLLSVTKGSLLEDESLVNTLSASKSTSEEVTSQLLVTEETEKKIDAARMGYQNVALRSSTLYFVLNDMTKVDPMYQFSLDSYIGLFKDSIISSRKMKNQASLSEELTNRITAINDYHTYAVYTHASRGLFERHKLLFSLQLCFGVMKSLNKIPLEEYDFLLKGGSTLLGSGAMRSDGSASGRSVYEEKVTNIASEYISDAIWSSLVELNRLPRFQGLLSSFEQHSKAWKSWYRSNAPETEVLPADWDGKCSELEKMLLIRCMRHDRLSIQASRFAASHLGIRFVDPPPFDLKATFESSNYTTPLIFILTPGIDPTNALMLLADSLHQQVDNCALGQGQASVAEAILQRGIEQGSWVYLANLHLMLSWAPTLEKWIDTYCRGNPSENAPQVNKSFRLWLSSVPNPKFPIALLQRGIKMTTEPPRGLKANLLRLYNMLTIESFQRCSQHKKYKRLLFCLCWFHSLLIERRKFNNLGWNIPYDFNESDFSISEDVLAIYLTEYEETPWDALKYLIAQVNYGGRVTDEWDRRLMLVYINQFFTDEVLEVDNMPLSDIEHYHVPNDGGISNYTDYIKQLPLEDPPDAFGQHPNAQIASQIEEGNDLFSTILSIQAAGVHKSDQQNNGEVLNTVQKLRNSVPELFDLANIKIMLQLRDDPDALKTVLLQEVNRYNKLLLIVHSSLAALERGIGGFTVITPELETIYAAILANKVPIKWGFCYPSMKPLASWIHDLKLRCDQITRWTNTGFPPVFWLSGLTYPTGFLTALLQTAARRNGISIDALNWEFLVMNQSENALSSPPKDGAYIKGLILEGAKWDFDHDTLTDPLPMQLHCSMPIIHFKPVETKKKTPKGTYFCPLYMYPSRTGTSERPSFIIAVELKCGPGKSSEIWTKRGTALLLGLSA